MGHFHCVDFIDVIMGDIPTLWTIAHVLWQLQSEYKVGIWLSSSLNRLTVISISVSQFMSNWQCEDVISHLIYTLNSATSRPKETSIDTRQTKVGAGILTEDKIEF